MSEYSDSMILIDKNLPFHGASTQRAFSCVKMHLITECEVYCRSLCIGRINGPSSELSAMQYRRNGIASEDEFRYFKLFEGFETAPVQAPAVDDYAFEVVAM
jgi:hypothetical protein